MVSGLFIFDFLILTEIFLDFDRKMFEMIHILPIYYSNFGQMGMGIDGLPPPRFKNNYTSIQNVFKINSCRKKMEHRVKAFDYFSILGEPKLFPKK